MPSLGDASVEITPDLSGFAEELRAKLAEATGGQGGDVRIKVDADTGTAQADLEAVKVEADRAGENKTIRVDADTAGANANLLATKVAADSAAGSAGGGGMGGLMAAGLALGPALVPVLGVATAGLGAMLAPLTAATVGFGSLGIFAIPAITEITSNLKKLQPDLQAFEAAQPGPAQGLAWAGLQAQIAKLPPELRPVVQGIVDIKLEIHNLGQTAGINQALFGAFKIFLDDAKMLLPQIAPAAKETALALGDLGTSVGKGLGSPVWQHFLDVIIPEIRPAIDAIGRSFGELIKGIGGVAEAFVPFAGGFESGMVRITTAFANWGQNLGNSQGFKTFMQWVKDNEHAVGDAIKNIADALINIVKASAGLGGIEIRAIGEVAKALSAIAAIPGLGPIVVDTGLLALAVGKLVTAAKGLGIVQLALGGVGSAATTAEGAAAGGGIAGLGAKFGALAGTIGPLAAIFGPLLFMITQTASDTKEAASSADKFRAANVNNITSFGQLNNSLGEVNTKLGQNQTAWWDNASVLSSWADKGRHVQEAFTPIQTDLINARQHILDLSNQWHISADAIVRAAGITGVSIHDLGNKGHDAQVALGTAIDSIEQKIGRLPPAVAADANQAMQGLTAALQKGQAPGAASQSEAAIEDAYKKLNVIPGMGQNVMNLLKNTIDSFGNQISGDTHKNVDDLIGNYQRLPPPIQDAVRKAMEELNSGLATGNQDAINDAKAKLATLSGNYAAFANDAGVQGTKAGHDFTSNLIGQMQDGLGSLNDAMAAYDAALAKGLNPLLSAIGAKTFGPGSEVPFFPAAAAGGIYSSPTILVAEGGYPEVVLTPDPAHRARNLDLFATAGHMLGIQGFAGGGIPNPTEATGFMDPSQVPAPPSAQFLRFGSVPESFGSATNQDAISAFNSVKSFVAAQAAARTSAGGWGGGTVPPGQCADWIAQGLAMPGANPGFGAACMGARIMNESGCNPKAINLTDSNAAAGHPSVGVAQFVPSTFQSVAVPGCTDINDPVCQIAASSKCSPGNCGHGGYGCATGCITSGLGGHGPVPLASGGIVTGPTFSLLGERGPEAVVPLGQGGPFGGPQVVVHMGDTNLNVASDVSQGTVVALRAVMHEHEQRTTQAMMAELRGHGVITPPGGTLG